VIESTREICAYLQARFTRTERGASLVEYALLVGLIAIVCVGAVSFFGSRTSAKYSTIGSSMN
jgi:pilus assembly protein Flp/PilA